MNQVCTLFYPFFETGPEKLCLLTELGTQDKSLLVDNEHIGKKHGDNRAPGSCKVIWRIIGEASLIIGQQPNFF